MNIAICDDEQVQRELIEKYIREWAAVSKVMPLIAVFESSEAFLFQKEDYPPFDLLILDIEMGGINGMELAGKLRSQNDRSIIVFVTGFEQYMSMGYEVEALHYLLKPLRKEKFFAVLDRCAEKCPEGEKLVFKTDKGMLAVQPSDIWYLEASGHNTLLHVRDQSYEVREGIAKVKQQFLADNVFCACHRSYFVNMQYVSAIEKGVLVMDDGAVIPVSRGAVKAVNKMFITFYCKK